MKAGDVVGGRFVIERLAGSGGMGFVYRAHDPRSGEAVALKVMTGNANALERFAREAEVLSSLSHPNIVRYVASGSTAEGAPWMAMEWLDGEDLERRLARGGLSFGETVDLAGRVAQALAAAHARGVVHRDIKPSNLFLPGGALERVTLLDFGVARLRDGAGVETRTGLMVGTSAYMAPEQARGQKDVDARADVFSLGCVLFECLVGRPPFAAAHVMAVLAKILLEDAPRLGSLVPEVPRAFDDLLGRMLSKDPVRRPRDGAALEAELAALDVLEPSRKTRMTVAPPSLTGREMQLLCVVLVGPTPVEPSLAETAATVVQGEGDALLAPLIQAVAAHGGRLEPLADGSLVVILSGTRAATDQAAQAARSALRLRAFLPEAPMALATGRALVAERWPVGEVIDRAAALVRASAPEMGASEGRGARSIRIDEVTAGLLDVRFEVGESGAGLGLSGEREIVEAGRTLLGRPTPCVGREWEMGLLEGLLRQCVDEPTARALLVTGAAGVGKSRLRYELLRTLKQRGEPLEVWLGRGDPLSAGSPFGMLAPALRRSAGILDGEPLPTRQKKLRARVARHVSGADRERVTEFMGELLSVPFPDDESVQLRAARADATLMGDQMTRAFGDFVAAETAAQPLLIVLEDLHWGDLPSVKLLDAALRQLADRPLMVLALGRPEVRELFPKLWAERSLEEVRLGALKRKGSEKLVRAVLGPGVSDELATKLWERSAGNAFYLEELIRAVAEGKGDALPETVLAMVQARLEGLGPAARRVLRAASVFGQVFWSGALAALLGEAEDGATKPLAELVERELVTRRGEGRFPGETEYVFRHATVREAAYAMLTDADRKLGHLLAGEWLERAGEATAVELAEHFERGGEPGRAVSWYRRAAEQALGGNDLDGAVLRAERGAQAGALGEALGELRLIQAEAHRWRGENQEAERRGAEALRLLSRGSASWCGAAGVTAVAAGRLGNMERLVAVARELEALAADGIVTGPSVIESARAAIHAAYHGRHDLAEALFAPIAEAAEGIASRDPAVRGHLMHAQATMALIAGDPGGCLDGLSAAAASFDAVGDTRNACGARGNVGYAFGKVGAYAEAERCCRDALLAADRLGLGYVAAAARHNLGPALAQLGRLEEARAVEAEAAAAFHAQGDRRLEAASRLYLAHFLEQGGDLAAARLEAEAAVHIAATVPGVRAYALGTLAKVLLASGKAEEAMGPAKEAMEIVEALGGLEEGEPIVRLCHAEVLRAIGDEAGARAALARAKERLLDRAAKIRDPRRRASLLSNVPEHARTMALCEAIGA